LTNNYFIQESIKLGFFWTITFVVAGMWFNNYSDWVIRSYLLSMGSRILPAKKKYISKSWCRASWKSKFIISLV